MHVIDIGPINDNPQTRFKLVFGKNISLEDALASLCEAANIRQKIGLTTHENTRAVIEEARDKLLTIFGIR